MHSFQIYSCFKGILNAILIYGYNSTQRCTLNNTTLKLVGSHPSSNYPDCMSIVQLD